MKAIYTNCFILLYEIKKEIVFRLNVRKVTDERAAMVEQCSVRKQRNILEIPKVSFREMKMILNLRDTVCCSYFRCQVTRSLLSQTRAEIYFIYLFPLYFLFDMAHLLKSFATVTYVHFLFERETSKSMFEIIE